MDITELPFNAFLGIEHREDAAYRLRLPNDVSYTNHLGTVHASAIMALAEATSGAVLAAALGTMEESLVPVVRRFTSKFRKPASGAISSTCDLSSDTIDSFRKTLHAKRKAILEIPVEVYDEANNHVASAKVEWFVNLKNRTDRSP